MADAQCGNETASPLHCTQRETRGRSCLHSQRGGGGGACRPWELEVGVEGVCQGRRRWRASSLREPRALGPCVMLECRLGKRAGGATWLSGAISGGSRHTLEIDGRRHVAPSPTPGSSLGWMLLSNVSSASSEGWNEEERWRLLKRAWSRGRKSSKLTCTPPMVCGGWGNRGRAPPEGWSIWANPPPSCCYGAEFHEHLGAGALPKVTLAWLLAQVLLPPWVPETNQVQGLLSISYSLSSPPYRLFPGEREGGREGERAVGSGGSIPLSQVHGCLSLEMGPRKKDLEPVECRSHSDLQEVMPQALPVLLPLARCSGPLLPSNVSQRG